MLTPSKIYAVKTRHPQFVQQSAAAVSRYRERQRYKKIATRRVAARRAGQSSAGAAGPVRAVPGGAPLFKHPEYIQPQRIRHQTKQQHHPHHLRIFNELITWLPAADHLHQRKQRMPPIQRRYRQHIHKCQ